MKTWPYQRVLQKESCDGPRGRMNYPDGFVSHGPAMAALRLRRQPPSRRALQREAAAAHSTGMKRRVRKPGLLRRECQVSGPVAGRLTKTQPANLAGNPQPLQPSPEISPHSSQTSQPEFEPRDSRFFAWHFATPCRILFLSGHHSLVWPRPPLMETIRPFFGPGPEISREVTVMEVTLESPAAAAEASPTPGPAARKRGGGPRTLAGRMRSRENSVKSSLRSKVVFSKDMARRILDRNTTLDDGVQAQDTL